VTRRDDVDSDDNNVICICLQINSNKIERLLIDIIHNCERYVADNTTCTFVTPNILLYYPLVSSLVIRFVSFENTGSVFCLYSLSLSLSFSPFCSSLSLSLLSLSLSLSPLSLSRSLSLVYRMDCLFFRLYLPHGVIENQLSNPSHKGRR